jgi:hypothetical protein
MSQDPWWTKAPRTPGHCIPYFDLMWFCLSEYALEARCTATHTPLRYFQPCPVVQPELDDTGA